MPGPSLSNSRRACLGLQPWERQTDSSLHFLVRLSCRTEAKGSRAQTTRGPPPPLTLLQPRAQDELEFLFCHFRGTASVNSMESKMLCDLLFVSGGCAGDLCETGKLNLAFISRMQAPLPHFCVICPKAFILFFNVCEMELRASNSLGKSLLPSHILKP